MASGTPDLIPTAAPTYAYSSSAVAGVIVGIVVAGIVGLVGIFMLTMLVTRWKNTCPSSCGECWKWTRYGNPMQQNSSQSFSRSVSGGDLFPVEATMIESSVSDRVFLSRRLSEAFSSSGSSKIIAGDFLRANNTTTKIPAILKMCRIQEEEKVMREYAFMTRLYGQFSEQFVEPYGLLRGVDNQIIPYEDNERYECSQYVVIAMEKGEMDMKTYLHENKGMPDTEKVCSYCTHSILFEFEAI